MKLKLIQENFELLLEMKETVGEKIEFLQSRDLNRIYVFWIGNKRHHLTGQELADRFRKYDPDVPAKDAAEIEFGAEPYQDIDFLGTKKPIQAKEVSPGKTARAKQLETAELSSDMGEIRARRKTREIDKGLEDFFGKEEPLPDPDQTQG